jgi:hypothetical protein
MTVSDIVGTVIGFPLLVLMIGTYLWSLITDPKGFFLFFFVLPLLLLALAFVFFKVPVLGPLIALCLFFVIDHPTR